MPTDPLTPTELSLLFVIALILNLIGWKFALFTFPKEADWKPNYRFSAFISTLIFVLVYVVASARFIEYQPLPLLIVLIYAIYFLTVERKSFAAIWKDRQEPKSPYWKDLGIALLLFVTMSTLVGFIQNFLQYVLVNILVIPVHLQDIVGILQQLKGNHPVLISFFFSIAVIVPIVEEFLFRANLQTFLKKFVSPKISILVTSLIFTLCHLGTVQGIGGQITTLFPLFVASLYLGFGYERQRSLIVPITMHCSINALSFFTALFG